jgi:inorganic triphosphatase YgiF
MPTEVELKLRIAPEHATRLQRHPLLKSLCRAGPARRKLYTVYYDTPDLDLLKHNLSLRLRRTGSRWLQTVKSGEIAMGGLYQRSEWESEITRQEPDFVALKDPTLPKLFTSSKLLKALQPIFVTEFIRSARLLEVGPNEEAEFCLDRGEIRANDTVSPICEVELELKSGNPARLFDIALELQKTIPLKLENTSKAQRGYRLYRDETPTPVKAPPLSLTRNTTPTDAFVVILWNCVQHLQANETGMLNQDDPEYLHQMRVALRRMRSAFNVFSKTLPEPITAPLVEEIKWLAGALGPARDWDIFYDETLLPVVEAFAEGPAVRVVQADCHKLREASHDVARQAVDSPRFQHFLLLLGVFLTHQPWLNKTVGSSLPVSTMQLVDFVGGLLDKRHKRLIKRGRRLTELNEEERHRLRIATKKLRYAADFFSSLYPGKRTRRYLKALASFQNILGLLNDAATTRTLLSTLDEHNPGYQQAIGLINGWSANAVTYHLQEMRSVWADCANAKVFWR